MIRLNDSWDDMRKKRKEKEEKSTSKAEQVSLESKSFSWVSRLCLDFGNQELYARSMLVASRLSNASLFRP